MHQLVQTRTADDLLAELDEVERAIARSRAFCRRTDAGGATQFRISPELLALAEREHSIVGELRRRHRQLPLAA